MDSIRNGNGNENENENEYEIIIKNIIEDKYSIHLKLNKLIFYLNILLLIISLLSIIFHVIIFFYIVPKELLVFKNKLNEINKFEKKVNIMEDKFNQIYQIVMNFCELFVLKRICYKNYTMN